jgi:hypothetical protein
MLLLQGCFEIETTTTVHRDGTLARTIVVSGDSAGVYGHELPFFIDSTWSFVRGRTDTNKHVLTISRVFPDAEGMSRAFARVDGKTLGIHVSLEKRFRWFTTVYSYREQYLRFNPFNRIPLTDYISSSEIDLFFRHEVQKEPYGAKGDSLALRDAERRYEEWDLRNIFESYFAEVLEGVRRLNDPVLTPDHVAQAKEQLYQAAAKSVKSKSSAYDTLGTIFESVLHSVKVRGAMKANAEGFQSFREKLRFVDRVMAAPYTAHVVVPGVVTDTNGPTVEGNKVTWRDFIPYCYVSDYELRVESRVTNWWAVIVSGLVVVVAGVVIVLGSLRKGSS